MTLSPQNRGRRRPLHRIQQVRLAEGFSLRAVARRMKQKTSVVRDQERADSDIKLTDLYRWQAALSVPVSELLLEPEPMLADPIKTRASMIRIATTVKAILMASTTGVTRGLAQDLLRQLVSAMPELEDLVPELKHRRWRDGKSNGPNLGRTAENVISTKWIYCDDD